MVESINVDDTSAPEDSTICIDDSVAPEPDSTVPSEIDVTSADEKTENKISTPENDSIVIKQERPDVVAVSKEKSEYESSVQSKNIWKSILSTKG